MTLDINTALNSQIALNQMNAKANQAAKADPKISEALNSFGALLNQQIQQVNELQTVANQSVETYATGGNIELHNVILAVEKADMALQLTTQVRNKLVTAYQEVSRMQF